MPEQTIAGTCADIDDLHRQIASLTSDNGSLRAQHHDLVRARDAAREDACMLRDELKATEDELATARATVDQLRIARDDERARANRTGW